MMRCEGLKYEVERMSLVIFAALCGRKTFLSPSLINEHRANSLV